ncbi:Phenoxybenzoate dioxygenase subunit beta [Pigmentiphaga humi]|uniref:Phenoxybenzoate dioxygenase subunit beta n=1 Tax=Pigmentiphaga humi TaxID=2478468 RepID=A0A3P4B5L5_9BURK|nr:PDR/VanB family oxidoreductase [Pigmentiphaga humi]VCU71191.1 Phenoxybenzoate dioxygenase subunit beta [Pigmentiphaga humi]
MNSSSLLTVLVQAIRLEAQGIISVEFRSPDGADLPAFEAGSHIDLHLPNGLVRSYSLFNSPAERHRYVVGVLNDRNSRGGSRYVHEQLRVGSTIKIGAPRNNFELDEGATKSVLLAGGIGVTPIFCMYNRLRSIDKPVELLYCARAKVEAAFVDELLASGEQVKTRFDAEAGGPPNLRELLGGHPADTHFYCCGPTPMLDAFEATCKELGYENVHIERFAAAGEVEAAQEGSYQVELAKSGKTIDVPAGMSLLDALLEAGVDADYSCREGVCGACETAVLEGTPDHRDSVLTEREREANKTMMVCVSGCKGSKLVLDL